ncbi:MAG: ribonuclease P protein component [Ignavibacteriales bacterium]|nr:ribonuclease P protein component [Ignavibacteriales bacterium]
MRGHGAFASVISKGTPIFIPPIRAYFLIDESRAGRTGVGFATTRQLRSAVERNRAKRLMREAYRLEKKMLDSQPQRKPTTMVLMYVGRTNRPINTAGLEDIRGPIRKVLKHICRQSKQSAT